MKLRFSALILIVIFLFSCAEKKVTVNKVVNKLEKVTINKLEEGYKVDLVVSSKNDEVKVFYDKSPYKLVVLIPGVGVDKNVLSFEYSDENIKSVMVFKDKLGANVEISLKKDVDYKYNINNNIISIAFEPVKPTKAIEEKSISFEDVDTENIVLGNKLLGINNLSNNNLLLIKFRLNGVVRYDYGYLDNGYLYVDLFDVRSGLKKKIYRYNSIVRKLQVGEYYPPQKVRVLAKLRNPVTIFAGQDNGYLVISSEFDKVPTEQKYLIGLDSIAVKSFQSIIVKTTGRVSYSKKVINGKLVIEFEDDLKVLKNVKNILTFRNNSPFKSVKVVKLEGKTALIVEPNGYEIYANVENAPEGIIISGSFESFSKASLKFSKGLELLESKKDKKKVNKEDLITLNIKDMDVREAIRLIYFGREKNLVFGNDVKGKATLFVRNIPYTQALNIILKENNLVKIEDENLVWIITKNKYASMKAEEIKKLKEKEEVKKLEPLTTEIIPVNYSKAGDYTAIVKSVLSDRGKLEVNTRTNSFVITDIKSAINKAKELLAQLDKRTPQVMIEARIVEVFDSNNLNLGIQWGGRYSVNSTSINFPNTVTVNGNTGATGIGGAGYLVNLPVASPAGALALSLGNLSRTFNLDIALSALESQNKVRTISSPRITTLDNEEAEIKSGGTAIIVPTGDNTETQEVDVGIKLKIKPHITQNNMVFLEIEVEKSSLGTVTANTATTEEKKAKTQVLLADGETTVIGGIYEDEKSEIYQQVPYLSKIPVLGYLFKSKSKVVTKKELLVFITPKIVK